MTQPTTRSAYAMPKPPIGQPRVPVAPVSPDDGHSPPPAAPVRPDDDSSLPPAALSQMAAPVAWSGVRLEWLLVAALTIITLATRLPLIGGYLVNWDAVQYALGLVDFDVVRHQPHPPGSILYVALGRLALAVTGDANLALSLISAVASAVSVALCYLVGRHLFGRQVAIVGTLLFATSPLTWFYGVVALPYALESALALVVVWLCWHAAEERQPAVALWAAAALAVAGGVRPTTLLLLLPLWLTAAWRAGQLDGAAQGGSGPAGQASGGAQNGSVPVGRADRAIQDGSMPVGRGGDSDQDGTWPGERAGDAAKDGRQQTGQVHPSAILRARSVAELRHLAWGLVRQALPRGVDWPRTRTIFTGLFTIGALSLVWVVPLLRSTRGLGAYLTASRQLSALASMTSSVLSVGLPAAATNISYLWDVVALGLNVSLASMLVYLLPSVRWPWRPSRSQALFLALWAGPALVVYSMAHIGQAGYALMLFPLACFAGATALISIAGLLSAAHPQRPLLPGRGMLPALVGVAAAANAVLFLVPPLAGQQPNGLSLPYIRWHDARWAAIGDLLRTEALDSPVILTGIGSAESFRHATYYFPERLVLAVGRDRDGDPGVAFAGRMGQHTYHRFMAGDPAAEEIALPPGSRRLLILDTSVADLFPRAALQTVQLGPGQKVWVYALQTSPSDNDGQIRRLRVAGIVVE